MPSGASFSQDLGTWLVGLIYVAILFVLVRPGSQGPSLVNAITGGMVGLMNAATGGGGWAAGAGSGTSAAPSAPAPATNSAPATPPVTKTPAKAATARTGKR